MKERGPTFAQKISFYSDGALNSEVSNQELPAKFKSLYGA